MDNFIIDDWRGIRIWPCFTRKAIIIKNMTLSRCCLGHHLVVHYSPCVLLFHTPPPPPPIISHYLYTDASLAGWGATDSQVTAGGAWDEEEPPADINVLELRAAYLALQSLCKHCMDSHVCLYMDNSTAVLYISKKGGTHSVLCDALAVEILQWAISPKYLLVCCFYSWRIQCSGGFLLSVSEQ